MSDIGARLTLASTVALPDMFDIAIPQRGISGRAKLVWRDDDQAGIDFCGDEDRTAPRPRIYLARIKALEAENAKLKAQIGALLQQVHRLTEEYGAGPRRPSIRPARLFHRFDESLEQIMAVPGPGEASG